MIPHLEPAGTRIAYVVDDALTAHARYAARILKAPDRRAMDNLIAEYDRKLQASTFPLADLKKDPALVGDAELQRLIFSYHRRSAELLNRVFDYRNGWKSDVAVKKAVLRLALARDALVSHLSI